MDKIFEISYGMLKEGNYKGIFKIIVGIFILFAPSLSIIWVYKRNIFNSLEFTKLMLLCIVINIVILIITMIVTYMFNSYKYNIYMNDSLNTFNSEIKKIKEESLELSNDKEKINEVINKIEIINEEISESKKKMDNMFSIDVILNMGYVSIMPWINYFFYYMNKETNNKYLELRYFLLSIMFITSIYGIICFIIGLKKTKGYKFRKKYIIENLIFESIIIINFLIYFLD